MNSTEIDSVSELGRVPETPDATKSSMGRLAAGAGISLAGKMSGRGLNFSSQIIIARLLGPESFGLYALAWSLLQIAGNLTSLGLQNGVIHFATSTWKRNAARFKTVLWQSIGLAVGVSALFSVALFFLAPWLGAVVFKEPEFVPAFRWFALILPLMAGLRVAAAATRISQRMQFAIYAEEVAQTGINLIAFIVFYFLGWHLLGAVWATVLSFGVAFGLAIVYVWRLFPEVQLADWDRTVSTHALLAFSVPTALSGTFGVLINRFDRLFLGYYWPATEVGVYQAASQFSIVFAIILNGFNAIFAPMIADLYHDGKLDDLEELYRVSTKWGLYSSLPFSVTLFLAPYDVMAVVFGSDYVGGVPALLILTVGQFINMATGAVGILLMMTGRQNRWFVISGLMVVSNVVLNIILVPRFGVIGAAVATTVTVSGMFLLGLWSVRQVLGLWPYDRRYQKGIVALIISILAVVLFRSTVHGPTWLTFAGTLVTSMIVFMAMLWRLGLDTEDMAFLVLIRKLGVRNR